MNLEPTGFLAAKAAVTGAIRNAAQVTGTSFQYLLATARVESNLNAHAAAPTSSAKGLFQFISQTWLATLKEKGPALGYARYAEAIERLPSGQYTVSDPKLHQQIMNLRADPVASALMAGAFTKANTEKLAAALGRTPTEGELYIAHFLGADGAAKLIELAQREPQTPASQMFPNAAGANHSIFYDRQRKPRAAAEVYQALVGRYEVARADLPLRAPPAPNVAAVAPQAAAVAAVTPPPAPSAPQPLAFSPVVAPQVPPEPAPPATVAAPVVPTAPPLPVFHGLFRSPANEPVAPLVNALWGTRSAQPSPPANAPPQQSPPSGPPPGPLDLFQDQKPDVGALFRGRV